MKKIFLIISLIIATSCSQRLTDFTAISTKNINLSGIEKGKRVDGFDCSHVIFGLIPIKGNIVPNLKQAIDNAIENGNGEILVDGVVYNNLFSIPPIYFQNCYKVSGNIGKISN